MWGIIGYMKSLDALPSSESVPSYQFNEFAADWPVSGNFTRVVEDVKEATLAAIGDRGNPGNVEKLKIEASAEGPYSGGCVPPRVLRGSGDVFDWFRENGYFALNRGTWEIEVRDKWRALFTPVDSKTEKE